MNRPKKRKWLAIFLKGTARDGQADTIIPDEPTALTSEAEAVASAIETLDTAVHDDLTETSKIDGFVDDITNAIAELP